MTIPVEKSLTPVRPDEVLAGVCACLADVLDIPAKNIRPEQIIIADLGADSLDLLDLSFHLERKFGIDISPREIQRRAQKRMGDKPFVLEGKFTDAGIVELRKLMPEVPPEELSAGLAEDALPRRLRVISMANLVCRLLEEKNGGRA